MSDAAKKLEDQLTCVICLEQYKDPRSLSCLHSFCTECLERLPRENEGKDESVSCPSCRTITKIPKGKITNFPISFHINNLLEVQDLLQKSSSSSAICNNCSKERANYYCTDCDTFLCISCNDFHSRWSKFSTHKVIGVEEVASQATKMVSIKPTPPMECPSHNEPLKVYCIKCDQPICYLCTIKDHKGHNHTLVNDAYEECKHKLKKRIQSLEETVQIKEEFKKVTEESKMNVQEKAKENQLMINHLCNSLIEKVEQLRRHGLKAVEMGTECFVAYKDEQIEKETASIQELNECKRHVEHSLEKNTPTQLLLIAKQIMERLDKLVGHSRTCSTVDKLISSIGSASKTEDLEIIQHQTMQNLKKNFLSAISLQYPQPVFEQCKLVTDLPESIQISRSSCTATFSLLFNGRSMVVNTNGMSCFFESAANIVHHQPMMALARGRHRVVEVNACKEKISCDVYYFYGDVVKYQVQFTPFSTSEGMRLFNVQIGGHVVDTKVQVNFVNNLP